MKICIVVDNIYPHAGWGRLAQKVAQQLQRQGHSIGFITQHGETENLMLKIRLRGSTFKNILSLPFTFYKIRAFIKQYDVVMCYDANPYGIVVMIASLGLSIKVVINSLGTYSLFTKNPIRNLLMRWVYRRASMVFVVSAFIKTQIEKNGFILPRSVIVPVGNDSSFFKPSPTKPQGIQQPYCLSIGAIKSRKGYDISIRAFAKIASRFPNLTYVIVGDSEGDNYFKNIQMLIETLHIKQRVVFLHKISDENLLSLYSYSEFFVLTPITSKEAVEGFGMVYLEAGSCGKPVIGTYNTGAEAAIINEYNGLLVQPEPDHVAEAMTKILNNKAYSIKLGKNAQIRGKEFDWSKIGIQYSDELQKVVLQK